MDEKRKGERYWEDVLVPTLDDILDWWASLAGFAPYVIGGIVYLLLAILGPVWAGPYLLYKHIKKKKEKEKRVWQPGQ